MELKMNKYGEEDVDVEKKIPRHASKTKAIEEQQKKALEEDPSAYCHEGADSSSPWLFSGGPSSLPSLSSVETTGYTSRTYDFECPVDHPLNRARFHNPSLLRVYAMAGLHRYNFLNGGTNWVFDRVKKVVVAGSLVSSYSITFYASQGQGKEEQEEKAFYVYVAERELGPLNIVVPIAKPLDHPDDFVNPDCCCSLYSDSELPLPEWPCDFTDSNRLFYKLTKPQWLSYDWVSLYLQLALCRSDWYTADQLDQIHIENVVIETYQAVKRDEERLEANKATLYIIYKDFDQAQRQAVIAREFDPNTGHLRLRASSGLTRQVVALRHYKLHEAAHAMMSMM